MKVEFENIAGFRDWLNEVADSSKYDLYFDGWKLYAVKNVSTSPKIHASVAGINEDAVFDAFDPAEVTHVHTFEWNHRHGGGSEDA